MKVTMEMELPRAVAAGLPERQAELGNIFTLGLRQWRNPSGAYPWLKEVLGKLASVPTPAEVLAWKLSRKAQARIEALLEKNRTTGLTPEEEQEWKCFEQVEHVIRLAKVRAASRLEFGA
ncbi:hypothetical protein LBMAG56_14640 [Verrucomicrobiota bacterium]|nr:hypothetical protein LBMAG56_14640 [Verrucomicrobiota bacterium]